MTEPQRILFVAANPSIDRLAEVDVLTVGAIHRPDKVLAVPGGKGLNAARAAVALGARVTAAAIVAGRAGEWIAERLVETGIDAALIRDGGLAETRTCLSVLDRSTGQLTEFYEPGTAIQPATWPAFEEALRSELGAGDVAAVVCSGSLPPGAPDDAYARIVRLAASAITIVDTHGAPLGLAVAEHPTVVKVNAAEAAEATGRAVTTPAEAASAARAPHRAGRRPGRRHPRGRWGCRLRRPVGLAPHLEGRPRLLPGRQWRRVHRRAGDRPRGGLIARRRGGRRHGRRDRERPPARRRDPRRGRCRRPARRRSTSRCCSSRVRARRASRRRWTRQVPVTRVEGASRPAPPGRPVLGNARLMPTRASNRRLPPARRVGDANRRRTRPYHRPGG